MAGLTGSFPLQAVPLGQETQTEFFIMYCVEGLHVQSLIDVDAAAPVWARRGHAVQLVAPIVEL